jgi:hypothetical protein
MEPCISGALNRNWLLIQSHHGKKLTRHSALFSDQSAPKIPLHRLHTQDAQDSGGDKCDGSDRACHEGRNVAPRRGARRRALGARRGGRAIGGGRGRRSRTFQLEMAMAVFITKM